jgi:hypothetical protein
MIIHLLTLSWRSARRKGFGALLRFNADEQGAPGFPIFNQTISNAAFAGTHQSP